MPHKTIVWTNAYLFTAPFISEDHISESHNVTCWGNRDLIACPPITVFFKDNFTWSHLKFLPRVSSKFHIKQPIHLPVFYPKPHLDKQEELLHSWCQESTGLLSRLNSSETLTNYLSHWQIAQKRLQSLFKWISSCINSCYESCNI